MRLMMRLAAFVVGALLAISGASAQTLYLQENLPYSSQGSTDGFMLHVVRAMSQVLKQDIQVRFMDWPVAQKTVREGKNGIIFPFTRTAAREDNYNWLLKFWDVDDKFFVRGGQPAVDSYDDAATRPSVGVVGGSAEDGQLGARGFGNLHRYANAPAVAAAVANGEVAVGYGPLIEMKYAWRSQQLPGSAEFGRTVLVGAHWIATSKDSPAINAEDWREAFEVVQQDGTFDRLYDEYFGARE